MRIVATVLALGLAFAAVALAQDQSPVIDFATGDPEMAAAKAKARATLPEFWQAFDHPGPGEEGFALKFAVPIGADNSEHIWMLDIKREAGKITGVTGNAPRDATWMREGERVEIPEDRISDWMFMRNGKMVGNETMRPVLKHMDPRDAERYRALYETP
jgi:uncharacterized protein YegJ (DUF2314 family)